MLFPYKCNIPVIAVRTRLIIINNWVVPCSTWTFNHLALSLVCSYKGKKVVSACSTRANTCNFLLSTTDSILLLENVHYCYFQVVLGVSRIRLDKCVTSNLFDAMLYKCTSISNVEMPPTFCWTADCARVVWDNLSNGVTGLYSFNSRSKNQASLATQQRAGLHQGISPHTHGHTREARMFCVLSCKPRPACQWWSDAQVAGPADRWSDHRLSLLKYVMSFTSIMIWFYALLIKHHANAGKRQKTN
jgi:hypothetical protein